MNNEFTKIHEVLGNLDLNILLIIAFKDNKHKYDKLETRFDLLGPITSVERRHSKIWHV